MITQIHPSENVLNDIKLDAQNSKSTPSQNRQNRQNPNVFPTEAFPSAMREMIAETAKAGLVPESLAGMVALGILSAAVGGGINIRSLGDKTLNANLFILAIAKSGTGKGVTYSALSKPLTEANLEDLREWREYTLQRIQSDIESANNALKEEEKLISGGKIDKARHIEILSELAKLDDEKAKEPQILCGETTEQKLGMLVAGQPHEAIGNHSSEARGLVQIILGKFGGSSTATGETMYLAGYSGDSYSIERVGRANVTLSNPCISCLFMVQPDVIEQLTTTDSMTKSGFLPRFIMADVKAEMELEPEHPHVINHKTMQDWRDIVENVLETYRKREEKVTIEVQSGAREILRKNLNSVKGRAKKGGDLEDLTSYAARYGENLRKIALLLHIGEHASDAHNLEINEATANNACDIANWFFSESLSILRAGQLEKWQKLHARLGKILVTANGSETLRELKKNNSISEDDVQECVSRFPESLEIREIKNASGGRPSKQVHLIH